MWQQFIGAKFNAVFTSGGYGGRYSIELFKSSGTPVDISDPTFMEVLIYNNAIQLVSGDYVSGVNVREAAFHAVAYYLNAVYLPNYGMPVGHISPNDIVIAYQSGTVMSSYSYLER